MSGKGTKCQLLEIDPCEEKKEIFYHEYADAVFKFDDGREIKFNKMLLFWNTMSSPIKSMLFGPLKQDIIEIKDCEYETFKLFLDCVVGVKEVTKENAQIIFPMCCKYMIKKAMESCAMFLKPEAVDADACQLLNAAVYYHFPQLIKTIKNFSVANNSHYKFLEVEEYRNLLSGEAVKEVVNWMEIDSYIFIRIVEWAKNYLEQEKDKKTSLKNLIKSLGINERMKIDVFESGSLLDEFAVSDLGKNYFSSKEIASFHEKEKKSKFPDRKYKWIKFSAGTNFEENFDINGTLDRKVEVEVKIGKIVMYDLPKPSVSCAAELYCDGWTAYDEEKCNEKKKFCFKFKFYQREDDPYGKMDMYINYNSSNQYLSFKWKFEKDCRILVENWNPIDEEFKNDEFYFSQKICGSFL